MHSLYRVLKFIRVKQVGEKQGKFHSPQSCKNRADPSHANIIIPLVAAGSLQSAPNRFADNAFTGNYVATIGVDFKIKTLEINGKRVTLQLWDTAGQEKFQTISAAFFRGSHGALIVYDITEGTTFDHVSR